jgi:hypothetical protein
VKNFTKSRQKYNPFDPKATMKAAAGDGSKSGSAPGGTGPLRQRQLELGVHSELQGARRGQSWHRRSGVSNRGVIRATASNLDTLLDRGFGRRVRMLLSFQRPSHPFRKVFLLKRSVRDPTWISERTDEYSARIERQHVILLTIDPAQLPAATEHTDWRAPVLCGSATPSASSAQSSNKTHAREAPLAKL